MAAVRAQAGRLLQRPDSARRLPPVLLEGETGTGKGLLARALHGAGSPPEWPVRRRQLCGDPGDAARGRDVRLRARAFTDARRPSRGCSRPRTAARSSSTRSACCPSAPGQAAQGRSRSGTVRRLGAPRASRSTSGFRRHQRGSGGAAAGAAVPRGSLPSAGRDAPAPALAARARRRHHAARRALPGPRLRRLRAARQDAGRRRAGGLAAPIRGRATCASWPT